MYTTVGTWRVGRARQRNKAEESEIKRRKAKENKRKQKLDIVDIDWVVRLQADTDGSLVHQSHLDGAQAW